MTFDPAGVIMQSEPPPEPAAAPEPAAPPAEAAPQLGPILFYDSASYTFPEAAEYVCLYGDGLYQYRGDFAGFSHYHWITVLGNPRFFIADYEPGNAVYEIPGRLASWADGRLSARKSCVVYCDRANLHRAHDELAGILGTHPALRWWIPTLDGRRWTAMQLSNDIAAQWGVWIPASRIWANQFAQGGNGAYDVSDLFGQW